MGEKKKGRMSHIQNILMAIEDKGYYAGSIRYINDSRQIEVIIDEPLSSGSRAFLERALDEANGEKT